MGYALHREVRAFLSDPRSFVEGTGATAIERLIALQVALEADDKTRDCRRYDRQRQRWVPTVTVELLTMWTGRGERTVSEMLRRLGERGLELRKVMAKDRNGDPVYACKGHATEFYIPPMPIVLPTGCHPPKGQP